MKNRVLLVILIVMAMTLIVAVPSGAASSAVSNSVGQSLCRDQTGKLIKCPQSINTHGTYKIKNPGQGEPRMEKVTYFYYMGYSPSLWWRWFRGEGYKYLVYWRYGCANWYWRFRTYKLPVGCNFRYQY